MRAGGKLDALAEDLKKRHAIYAQSIVADLSKDEDIARIADMLADMGNTGKLDLLINNAGFGITGNFVNQTEKDDIDMLNVHAAATMRLTRAALPSMINWRRGGIINVASVAGWFPLPGNVNYSATKRYIITFSEALQLNCLTRAFLCRRYARASPILNFTTLRPSAPAASGAIPCRPSCGKPPIRWRWLH